MNHVDFSSWPREQEATFAVYEARSAESSRKGFLYGGIAGLVFFVLLVGIYAGVTPDRREPTKGMNMENLSNRPTAEK